MSLTNKLWQGRDVESAAAVTPMYSDLDRQTKGTAGNNDRRREMGERAGGKAATRGLSCTTPTVVRNGNSVGLEVYAHSYHCRKSTRGRYRHDSHRPCVVLAFRRMCK